MPFAAKYFISRIWEIIGRNVSCSGYWKVLLLAETYHLNVSFELLQFQEIKTFYFWEIEICYFWQIALLQFSEYWNLPFSGDKNVSFSGDWNLSFSGNWNVPFSGEWNVLFSADPNVSFLGDWNMLISGNYTTSVLGKLKCAIFERWEYELKIFHIWGSEMCHFGKLKQFNFREIEMCI